jgi:hypothetical protein
MTKTGLEIWLQQGKEIQVGPKTLLLLPTPLFKLRGVTRWLDDTTKGVLLEAMKTGDKDLSPWGIMAGVVREVDVPELCVRIFERKNPQTGEPINSTWKPYVPWIPRWGRWIPLDKAFFEEYLDTPTARRIVLAFIEVNDLEEALKNLQSLPVVSNLMEVLKSTFGLPFLTYLAKSTGSSPGTSEGSAFPKSSSTSGEHSIGIQESGPSNEKTPTIM